MHKPHAAPAPAAAPEQDLQDLTVLAGSAWVLGAGRAWQNDWLDLGDWLTFASFIDPTGLPNWAQDSSQHLARSVEVACGRVKQLGWLLMADPCTPSTITAAGAVVLARHQPLVADLAARLDWLAPHLPTANQDRSWDWYLVCEWWQANEAACARSLAADALEPLRHRYQVKQLDPLRKTAILANLTRLRAAAARQFAVPLARPTTKGVRPCPTR